MRSLAWLPPVYSSKRTWVPEDLRTWWVRAVSEAATKFGQEIKNIFFLVFFVLILHRVESRRPEPEITLSRGWIKKGGKLITLVQGWAWLTKSMAMPSLLEFGKLWVRILYGFRCLNNWAVVVKLLGTRQPMTSWFASQALAFPLLFSFQLSIIEP